MDSETARALIASILYAGDCAANPKPTSWEQERYLQRAHYALESSYLNYKHPAGEDSSTLGVDEALALLTSKGYSITAPVFPS